MRAADVPLGTPGAAVLVLTDNDLAGKVRLAAPGFSGLAALGSITLTVRRRGLRPPTRGVPGPGERDGPAEQVLLPDARDDGREVATAREVPAAFEDPVDRPGVLSLIARGSAMAQLVVRKLETKVVMELRKRAARSGRSMEAEHREILRAVLLAARGKESLKELLLLMPAVGQDSDFARPKGRPRRARY